MLFVKKRILGQLLTCAFGMATLASSALGQQKRYLAVLGDGRRVTGDKLTGWHASGGKPVFSDKAIKDVATARKAGVWRPRRTPSTFGDTSYDLAMRNRSDEDIAIFQINRGGGFQGVDQIKPGEERKVHSHEGFRYEAYVVARDYGKREPVSRVLVKGDTVWEIK